MFFSKSETSPVSFKSVQDMEVLFKTGPPSMAASKVPVGIKKRGRDGNMYVVQKRNSSKNTLFAVKFNNWIKTPHRNKIKLSKLDIPKTGDVTIFRLGVEN